MQKQFENKSTTKTKQKEENKENKDIKKIIQEIINLAEINNIKLLNQKIEENIGILTSEEGLEILKKFLEGKHSSNVVEELSELFFGANNKEKLNILWKIFVVSAINSQEIIKQIKNTEKQLLDTLRKEKGQFEAEINALNEIINKQGKIIKNLNNELEKIKHENKQLLTILKQISDLFQINNFKHLPVFLRDFKIKSKKTAELVKELQKLGILENTQNNKIVISPKIISFLKEFETKIIIPNNGKDNKKIEKEEKNLIKAEELKNHKIKYYKPHKIESTTTIKKTEAKEKKLLEQIEELKKQLKEKESKLYQLEEKNKTLEQNLSEKEKLLEEQNKKIKEIINKLDEVEKKSEENNKTNHNPQAVRSYQEIQQSN